MHKIIRVGSRDSVLAIKQAEIVMAAALANNPRLNFEHVKIKTRGDKVLDRNLSQLAGEAGKGLFIKELETALLDEHIDIAVHSYKDMPYEENKDLPIVAISKRESPFDVLVLPKDVKYIDFDMPVGSCSQRRTLQFSKLYPSGHTKDIRGNVITRLSRLDSGEYSALILAHAGLNRLRLQDRVTRIFTADEMIPSASQGILAVQGRPGEDHSYLLCVHSQESEIISRAERQFLKTLESSCTSPVAAYAQVIGKEILLRAMYASKDGNMQTGEITGEVSKAEHIASSLAIQLKKRAEGK